MDASESRPAAFVSLGQSSELPYPSLSFFPATLASEKSILCTTWSLLISRLNTATGNFCSMEACAARLRQKADFPIPGRPAMIIRSEGCSPLVILSNSTNPVATPVTYTFLFERLSMYSKLSLTSLLIGTKPLEPFSVATLKSIDCALSIVCFASPSAKPICTIWEETSMTARSRDLSFTILA